MAKGQFMPGHRLSVGNAGRQPPSLCTQTLISQLNEIDSRTGKAKIHFLCDTLYKLATGYSYKKRYRVDGKIEMEEVDVQPDVAAIKEIIDRVQGKAPQAVQVGGDPDNPIEVVNVIERIVTIATFSQDEDAPAQDAGSLHPAN